MYRFRRCGGFGAGLAYLPPERPLRGTRLMKLLAARRHPRYLLNRKSPAPVAERKGPRMRNLLKATTLESKFPALAVEGGCIISKDAGHNGRLSGRTPGAVHRHVRRVRGDPRCLVQGPEGLARIQRGTQAGLVHPRALPPGHGRGDMSFLSRSYERHFNERPFLTHACFLYLTKTTRGAYACVQNFSTLCRGNIIPKEVNRESATKFLEAAEQFERILNDSGF